MKNYRVLIIFILLGVSTLNVNAQIFGFERGKSLQFGVNISKYAFANEPGLAPKSFPFGEELPYILGGELGYYVNIKNVIRFTYLNADLYYSNFSQNGDIVRRRLHNFSLLYQRILFHKNWIQISAQTGMAYRKGDFERFLTNDPVGNAMFTAPFFDLGIVLGANVNIPIWGGINAVFDINYTGVVYREYDYQFVNIPLDYLNNSKQMVNLTLGISYAFDRKK